eukprot:3166921-Rhodomonas_salina.1
MSINTNNSINTVPVPPEGGYMYCGRGYSTVYIPGVCIPGYPGTRGTPDPTVGPAAFLVNLNVTGNSEPEYPGTRVPGYYGTPSTSSSTQATVEVLTKYPGTGNMVSSQCILIGKSNAIPTATDHDSPDTAEGPKPTSSNSGGLYRGLQLAVVSESYRDSASPARVTSSCWEARGSSSGSLTREATSGLDLVGGGALALHAEHPPLALLPHLPPQPPLRAQPPQVVPAPTLAPSHGTTCSTGPAEPSDPEEGHGPS